LAKLGCAIYAISADTLEQTLGVTNNGITFPIAYGCTEANAAAIGAWWGDHPPGGWHIEPTEFLLRQGGLVLGSMYASGPIGRMGSDEAVSLITNRERRRS
jgi:hypothetical protein